MKSKRLFEDVEDVQRLAELLATCPAVKGLEDAWELAHTFSDLEESFSKCLDEYFARFQQKDLDASEVKDLLLDIGEELRHILYHIETPAFYAYLHSKVKA